MTVGRREPRDGPIYVRGDSQDTRPAPELGILLSSVDGSLNLVPVCDLKEEVLKVGARKSWPNRPAFQEEIRVFFHHHYKW